MKKLTINELFEAFNHSSLCMNRLKGVVLDTEKYYTDHHAYNFVVIDNGEPLLVKYFTKDAAKAKETIEFVRAFGKAPFVESEWLERELVVGVSEQRTSVDLACYRLDFHRTLQEVVAELCATNRCSEENEAILKSFFELLRWLVDAGVVVDKLSLKAIVVDDKGGAKINLAANLFVRRDDADTGFVRCLAALVQEVLESLAGGSGAAFVSNLAARFGLEIAGINFATASKADLVKVAEVVLKSDLQQNIPSAPSPMPFVNCFNNEKYSVEEESRSEDRVVVLDNETQLKGYAALNGRLEIECLYEEATAFAENCAVVVRAAAAGAINRNGETVVDFAWNWVEWDYRDNVFRLNRGERWWVMRRYADSPAPGSYAFVAAFDNGKAIASRDAKEGIIDVYGNELVPLVYDSITDLGQNRYALVRENNKEILYL